MALRLVFYNEQGNKGLGNKILELIIILTFSKGKIVLDVDGLICKMRNMLMYVFFIVLIFVLCPLTHAKDLNVIFALLN